MKAWKTVLSIAVTILIFAVIFRSVNVAELKGYFAEANPYYFSLAMLLFVPTTVLAADRWKLILDKNCNVSRTEVIKLMLSSSAFNAVTPSKLGDFAPVYFLKKQGILSLKRGVNGVLFLKAVDVLAICAFSLAGILALKKVNVFTTPILLFSSAVILGGIFVYLFDFSRTGIYRRIAAFLGKRKKIGGLFSDLFEFLSEMKKDTQFLAKILGYTATLWIVEFVQIYFLFTSLNYFPPVAAVIGLVPAAILVGLIPVTIGGMGTRDAALIVLFSEYMPASFMVGVSLLISLRYWVPALIGLPFTKHYLDR